jgi:hypothetical protein
MGLVEIWSNTIHIAIFGRKKIYTKRKRKKRLYDIVGMDFVTLTFVKSNIWNF